MALDLANIRNLPAQLAASFKGLFKKSEQTTSGVTGNLRRQLVVLLVVSLIALLALLMYLLQVNRDNKFTAAAGDVQVFVQQAARDAALSAYFSETASIRLMNVMGSINSDIQLMRDLESATIFKGGQVKPLIDEVDILWQALHKQIKEVHQASVKQQEAGDTAVSAEQSQTAAEMSNIVNTSDQIIAAARKSIVQYEVQGKARLWMIVAIVAGIASLLLLVYIGYGQVSRARQQFVQIE